jgi:2-polyprenyl-3-methyl-5-hydroxy-6-metoxy-1,4-benzoquinol methylase
MDLPEEYFNYTRKEIEPMIPDRIDRVLEIGCGTGNTLLWLKKKPGCSWVGGVELFPEAFKRAQEALDEVWQGNIESMDLPIERASLDLVLCLDVLEHTIDPWQVLKILSALVRPSGAVIVSLPNVRNNKVILPLLFRNEWKYKDEGILDRTHLRFFVRQSAIDLVESAGLRVDMVLSTGLGRSRTSKMVNSMLPPFLKSLFEKQYLIRGIKDGA